MTGYIVVPDDDALRDRLAETMAQHQAFYQDGYLNGEPGYFNCGSDLEHLCGWRSDDERDDHMEQHLGHVGDVLRAVLRDVGTPATTETGLVEVRRILRQHLYTNLTGMPFYDAKGVDMALDRFADETGQPT